MSLSHRGHPARYGYRFRNDTNEEISCSQGSEKQFGRRVKRCLFMKGNQDQNITQRWTTGQQNIERRKKYQIAAYSCGYFLRAKQPLVGFFLCIFSNILINRHVLSDRNDLMSFCILSLELYITASYLLIGLRAI